MSLLRTVYRTSLALLTDLYQLTMGFGYWKEGMADERAAFHLFFRKNPFQGGYAVTAGLEQVVEYLRGFRFTGDDLVYLATLTGNDGQPLFDRDYLSYLGRLKLSCRLDAVAEGTVVFPQEPILRVTGPILECQLLETPLLNLVNFQTLVATKAARVCQAAAGDPVIEFGLRRAQGIDGGVSASRAAFIGGCQATSNVLAGKLLGIPVRGTHAHSWVMAFETEQRSFARYADAMPNNCVFLVDTYDSLEGVRHAIEVGRRLREQGHEMVGIRLDSGDLAYLSIKARRMLDEAGFPGAKILASNDLDERIIDSLKQQGARIGVWGVGTKLVTAFDQPALGGVYKLTALCGAGGVWQHKLKLSEQAAKISTPGILQIRRFSHRGMAVADMIYDELTGVTDRSSIVDPADATRRRSIAADLESEDLLVPVFDRGELVRPLPALAEIQERTQSELARLHPGIRRQVNPHEYPVGLEPGLHALKQQLVLEARGIV
jgi:nicotinate phosphoribosyltransferase